MNAMQCEYDNLNPYEPPYYFPDSEDDEGIAEDEFDDEDEEDDIN